MCICVHLWSVFLERIRAQFGKQAEVYARMRQTTDERSLNALVQLTG